MTDYKSNKFDIATLILMSLVVICLASLAIINYNMGAPNFVHITNIEDPFQVVFPNDSITAVENY